MTHMRALSTANDIIAAVRTETSTALLDQACGLVELGLVHDGLDHLLAGLERLRNTMNVDEWRARTRSLRTTHPLTDMLYQDPLTSRAFAKPRGYAGDAVMMDYIYGIHGAYEASRQASDAGRAVHQYIQSRPAATAVRNRREHIAQLIDETAAGMSRPDILAVASGHVREVELSTALASARIGRFVALDADAESLREVDTQYASLGVETVHASVRHILARKVELDQFDFVYAAGLYDYLNDAVASALTARLFELTRPGGRLLIPNFAPCCPDRAYLEAFMAWDLIYRDEFDMTGLLARIPAEEIASYDIYSDRSRSIVYLMIRKAACGFSSGSRSGVAKRHTRFVDCPHV